MYLVPHLRLHNVPEKTPICTYFDNAGQRKEVQSAHVTNALRWAVKSVEDKTGIPFHLISMCSLQPGGATALLCANVDKTLIQLIGHWKSDAMLHYLHVFTMSASQNLSSSMVKHGAFTFDQAQVAADDPAAFPCETLKVVLDLTIPYE